MTVSELISKLRDMPSNATIVTSNTDGCSECNRYEYDQEHDAYSVVLRETVFDRRKKTNYHIVVITQEVGNETE